MRGADQPAVVEQELAGGIVQPAALVRTDVQPGPDRVAVTMDDDRLRFARDHRLAFDDPAVRQSRTAD